MSVWNFVIVMNNFEVGNVVSVKGYKKSDTAKITGVNKKGWYLLERMNNGKPMPARRYDELKIHAS